jgi:hypothetical protein
MFLIRFGWTFTLDKGVNVAVFHAGPLLSGVVLIHGLVMTLDGCLMALKVSFSYQLHLDINLSLLLLGHPIC